MIIADISVLLEGNRGDYPRRAFSVTCCNHQSVGIEHFLRQLSVVGRFVSAQEVVSNEF
jgi:hypothetical protein